MARYSEGTRALAQLWLNSSNMSRIAVNRSSFQRSCLEEASSNWMATQRKENRYLDIVARKESFEDL